MMEIGPEKLLGIGTKSVLKYCQDILMHFESKNK